MTDTPARIVAQLLVDYGVAGAVGGVSAWPVYIGPTPDTPDNVLVVRNTTGGDESDILPAGALDLRYGFQLMVRGRTEILSWSKTLAAAAALRTVHNETVMVGAVAYAVDAVTGLAPPLRVGEESATSKRLLYSLNGMLTVRQL